MRKLAPVFFSSILVLTSGTALALGDMHKNKKAPKTDNTSQMQSAPASTAPDTNANSAVAPSPGSSSYESINKDSTSPSANSGAAMSESASASSDVSASKAKKPGNAKSTPDAKIQRDNNNETNNPSSAPSSTSKMSGVAPARPGFIKTHYGTSDKGTVSSDDNSGTMKKKQVARNDDRCDQSKHKTLPKDCVEHAGTGAAATNDTQGQSGGAGASGPGASAGGSAGAAGSAAGAGASSSGSAAGGGSSK